MKFHIEGLESKQIKVLKDLSPHVAERGFYLGGGTALAIYFGHRRSIDLDWFIFGQFGDALLLAQSLRQAKLDFVTEQTAPGTLHGSIDGVHITFLEFRYPCIGSLIQWKEMDCSLASLEDLVYETFHDCSAWHPQGFLRHLRTRYKTILLKRDA